MDDQDDPGEVEVTQVEVDLRGPFTLDEIDEIERMTGIPLPRWFDGQSPEGALRRAIAYITVRRVDPSTTLAVAGQMIARVG